MKMSQKAISWIQGFGLQSVADSLGVGRRTIEKWIQGTVTPRPSRVTALISIAASRGVKLRLEDFYSPTTSTKER